MKRIFAVMLFIMLLLLTGCPDKNKKSNSDKTEVKIERIDKKAAEEFLNNYMFHAMKRDINAMSSYYSSNLKQNYNVSKVLDEPRPVGYKIETEGEESEYKVHVFNAYLGYPYFSDDVFKYKIILKDGKMLIDEIKRETSTEIYSKGKKLYKRMEENSKEEFVISLDELPNFVSAQNMLSLEQKYQVPKKKFGPCAVSSEGDMFVISSVDENSFVGVVKLEEQVFKVAEKGQEETQGTQQDKEDEEKEEKEQKQVKFKALDYFLNKVINLVIISPDGKKILVVTEDKRGKSDIKAYNSDDGTLIELSFESQFKGDVFSLKDPFFISDKEFVFKVDVKSGATQEEKKLKGDWIYDFESKKFRQIKQF
ncbi:hypothetical protein SAMN05660865_01022 [Caloramator fervidus]|uniref:Lipoprotein n=1 Tax=Caloramator fervidus TaxID=29344 RepID=A0A1H5UVL0_9CLOT|nr:hypothetical protein [Caloramator fervidus]SEF79046.1 hypothetical protein SAMN05660865_01022 [Caloramator fervidus]